MGFNCLKAAEPLRGSSLLFTNKSPGEPGTYLIDLGRMKDWFDLKATHCFWARDPESIIQRLTNGQNHERIAKGKTGTKSTNLDTVSIPTFSLSRESNANCTAYDKVEGL